MPNFIVPVKLVKVLPGYFEIDAEDEEDAIQIAQELMPISEMTCDESKFYEDIIVDKKNVMRIE